MELEKLKTNFKAVGVEIEKGREHEGRYLNIFVNETTPFYKANNRHKRHGGESDESDEKKTYPSDRYDVEETEDGESVDAEKVKKKRASEWLVTNNKSLEGLIRSFVIDASNHDERGAMVVASVNRIAKDQGLEKGEVKAAIDRMIQEGELEISQDDYCEFVKVPGP